MDIVITAIHCDVSDAVKDYAHDKVQRLDKFFVKARKTDVNIHAEPGKNIVELICSAKNQNFYVHVTSEGSIREAIDLAVDKMAKQLRRFKGRVRSHKGKENRQKLVEDLQRTVGDLSARIEAISNDDDDLTYEEALDED